MFSVIGLLNLIIGLLLIAVSGAHYLFLEPKLQEIASDFGMSFSNMPYYVISFLLATINFILFATLLRDKKNPVLRQIGTIYIVISLVALGWLSMTLVNNSVFSIYNLTTSF